MATDSAVQRVAGKEIRLLFSSSVAWLFLASFATVSLFIFFWIESFFARNTADARPLFEWLPVLLVFLCSALTMRMWSDERRNGTLEHLLTQPVPLWQLVLGKFLACLCLLLLALVATLPLPVTVALIADLDPGPVAAGYLASLLLGAAYLAAGLFVSARTDNAIVSLIGSVALCGALYLVGSPAITGFVDDRSAEFLRLLGTGARFESIQRGIIDLRDLCYYGTLIAAFLALNTYSLERERWARRAHTGHHRRWRAGLLLVLLNLLLLNLWLAPLGHLRLDTTEGRQFSISEPTRDLLAELGEPLLIRGYFSARTHPLLAPLVPQLRDLVREYEALGGGRVRVEFIDPADHPELEEEANKRFNIAPAPFQVADRHQSAVVNAYFSLLVQYGSSHRVLGFSDLIEVRTAAGGQPEVMLRNPEYDLSHAIKQALFDYRMGGNLFAGIEQPVELIGYVSGDELLPDRLAAYRDAIAVELERAARHSDGKFSFRFIEPEARDGIVARQIGEQWGFRPMVTKLDDTQAFYFYLTLADGTRVVQLPLGDFVPTDFRLILDTGLKRFARGFTRTVALALPDSDPRMAEYGLGGPTFDTLERAIARSYTLELEDLADGEVSPEADILAVVAPRRLEREAVYAIDQFLMRGGTVVLATSPFTVEPGDGTLNLQDQDSGLSAWLAHQGITIDDALVLDEQNAAFPAPVIRQSGDQEFRDVRLLNYPYFIDLRPDRMAADHAITTNLPQVTLAWASPVEVRTDNRRRTSTLLESSPRSWLSDDPDITPRLEQGQDEAPLQRPFSPQGSPGPFRLGVLVQGVFDSFFAGEDSAPPPDSGDTMARRGPVTQAALAHSPEAARIVLYGSNDFLGDRALTSQVTATGTQYLGPVELFMNTLDWALQDDQLLSIRSRGHFNRTLPPMERRAQALIEYFNYGLALLWLALLGLASLLQTRLQRRRYRRLLAP